MCVWMTKKIWSRWQKLQQSPRQLADLSCVLLTGSAEIFCCCLICKDWLVSEPVSPISRYMFSRVSAECTLMVLFTDFQKATNRFFMILKWKEVEILLQKKRLKMCFHWHMPGFTLLAGSSSYLCVWSSLFTLNKATKETWRG